MSIKQGLELTSLPFDVILDVLHQLSLKEILVFGQTCRLLRDSTASHSVWARQNSHRPKIWNHKAKIATSTEELRCKVVRNAILESKCRQTLESVKNCTILSSTINSDGINDMEILPGGDWVVIYHHDAQIEILPTGQNQQREPILLTIEPNRLDTTVIEYETLSTAICTTSETGGYLIIEATNLTHGKRHVLIASFQLVDQNCDVTTVANFEIGQERTRGCWSCHDDTFSCTYQCDDDEEHYHISFFKISTVSSYKEVRFKCPKPDPVDIPLSPLFMFSASRFLVTDHHGSVCIFELPQPLDFNSTARAPISLSKPIWVYQGGDADHLLEYTPGPVFCDSLTSQVPKIWVLESVLDFESQRPSILHCLTFSDVGNPIADHKMYKELPIPLTQRMGFLRVIWTQGSPNSLTVSMISLSTSRQCGSFEIQLEDSFEFTGDDHYSFDETSGCFAALIAEKHTGKTYLLVVHIMNMGPKTLQDE